MHEAQRRDDGHVYLQRVAKMLGHHGIDTEMAAGCALLVRGPNAAVEVTAGRIYAFPETGVYAFGELLAHQFPFERADEIAAGIAKRAGLA